MKRILSIVLLTVICFGTSLQAADQLMEVQALRRPVAIEHVSDFNQLVVLNQRSASLSFLDLTTQQVVNEVAIGGKPTDMELVDGTNILAITNEETHLISLYQVLNNGLSALADIKVCTYPRHVQYEPEQGL